MIIALLRRRDEIPDGLVQELADAGFFTLDLDECVPDDGRLSTRAAEMWGADFRIRLARDRFDPLRNEIVTGIARIEELLALSRTTRTGVIDPNGRLTDGERAMLEAAHIPVYRLPSPAPLTFHALRPALLDLAARLPRISWDEYFMRIAGIVASRGDCVKRRVAALIIKDRRIVATGYNGAPRGVKNCSDGGCPRCASLEKSGTNLGECLCSHGEENAIIQAAYHGISVKGATLYSTCSPCLLCTKMIINSGIAEVVYNAAYPMGERALELLRESGVKARKYNR
jgi:dCMP deaminase